ncbi:MAG: hypothetical protein AUK36_03570 [Zetaproteobacteria bacterium CG2_30_59_37]|nr:MAG: hypothetical protein AUK36_03570 [Zetaproteobacteria bacterium CG2_30_59_37]
MDRAQKQAGEKETGQRAVRGKSASAGGELANMINNSPAMTAQRKQLDGMFGGAIQRVEDEEPLQGKFETVQRAEDEELMQGKFDTAQRVEEEEPLQGKFDTAQRVEEDEPLQGKFDTAQLIDEEEPLQGKSEAASSIQLKDVAAKPNNTGLPDNLKNGIENLSGMSMDGVKVHYNSSQPAQLNALAYAQGTDIHVAPGQEQHLPHEAWHIVQQAEGRVQPTMQMKDGVPVNDDQSLEHEADVMGAKATTLGVSQAKSKLAPGIEDLAHKDSSIQMVTDAELTEKLNNLHSQAFALLSGQGIANQSTWFKLVQLLDSRNRLDPWFRKHLCASLTKQWRKYHMDEPSGRDEKDKWNKKLALTWEIDRFFIVEWHENVSLGAKANLVDMAGDIEGASGGYGADSQSLLNTGNQAKQAGRGIDHADL